jgi:phosphatidylserine/phosphatidylglycerophosphate/cardiolipin synthase-like enzyme
VIQWFSDMRSGFDRTKRCIDILKKAAGSSGKLRIMSVTPDMKPDYVHTKTWIFDDETAIIGSANGSRRSYTCDTEATVQIFDQSREDRAAWRFARRLRVRLWADLLGLNTPAGHAELADGVASVVHWDSLPPGNRLSEYEPTIESLRNIPEQRAKQPVFLPPGTLLLGAIDEWDDLVDPFKNQIGR